MFGKLLLKSPDGTTSTIDLTKRQMLVGRGSDADVVVNDPAVSRKHAMFLCAPEGVALVDAGSANGTFIGEARVPAQQPIPLKDGTEIRVGQVTITFQAARAQPSSAPPSPPKAKPARAPQETPAGGLRAVDSGSPPPPPAFTPPPEPPVLPEPDPASRGPVPGLPTDRSSYLKHLPAIYSTDDFIGRFLLIFESILSPLDRTVDNLHHYFDARLTPPDFLPWLASWLGLVLDERWPEAQRRELIRSAVDLYEWRGTRRGLAEFIRLYTGCPAEIVEHGPNGKAASGANPEDAFRFTVRIVTPNPASVDRAMVQSIIDVEKPAHAGYTLEVVSGR